MAANSPFAVAKTSVELYKIRHTSGCYWADITIDAQGHAGRITIASDYGTWQNYWGACGHEFKDFLASLNHDYVATKFGAEQWIDVGKSLEEFKKMVASYERHLSLSADEAKAIRSEIKELASESSQTISAAIEHSEKLYNFLYANAGEVDFMYKPNPHFARFWKEIWPVLLAEFAREKDSAAPIDKNTAL